MATDFGVDINCVTDLDPSFALVTGQTAVGQAVARRLITVRGTLLDDPHYGTDLRQYAGEPKSAGALARAKADCEREARQEERVDSVEVETSYQGDDVLLARISLTTAEGPFELTLAVTAVTATILAA